MVGFSIGHRLADPAHATGCDPAFRSRLSSRHGAEPDRGLVRKTSRPAFCQCHSADACPGCSHCHDRRLCDSAAGQANAGTGAQRAHCLAGYSRSYRIGHAKLSHDPRSIAAHR